MALMTETAADAMRESLARHGVCARCAEIQRKLATGQLDGHTRQALEDSIHEECLEAELESGIWHEAGQRCRAPGSAE